MISYCGTCDEQDESQFFKPSVATAFWNATCRPTSTLLLPVELIAFDNADIKYSTVQNWYAGDTQGKGGIYNFVTKRGLCAGKNSNLSELLLIQYLEKMLKEY